MGSKEGNAAERCRLSDPFNPHTLRLLRLQFNEDDLECFTCGPEGEKIGFDERYYRCDICEIVFHKNGGECHLIPQGLRHPYHLQHPLTFTFRFSETKIWSLNNKLGEIRKILSRFPELDKEVAAFESKIACDWCRKDLGKVFYRCMDCGFSLDTSCIHEDPPFIIEKPKSHQHPLTFFPRALLLACSACGLDGNEEGEPGYACLQCNYLVHKRCIDLPRVIKLTRHPHRFSLTPCLPPPAARSCRVCRRKVDVKYGLYSCNKGCPYAIHSKCATHEDIWDGIDLEGVPEDPIEDLSPFVVVGKNLIKHFRHEHHLMFEEDGLGHDHDVNKQCQACCRTIDYPNGFYYCILHCGFFFHASCANLPKKKEHPTHRHPLALQSTHRDTEECYACGRTFSGFMYSCCNPRCEDTSLFTIDVVCASISEPLEHKVHPHPLYIDSHVNTKYLCGVCGKNDYKNIFRCEEDCGYIMCFTCATTPVDIHYKYDKHPLVLSGGEDFVGQYWCEVCERELDPKKWFYTCDECCTTLHVECIFGDFAYVKIGADFSIRDFEFKVASNLGNTRPICRQCGGRCLYANFFGNKNISICSFGCLSNFYDSRNSCEDVFSFMS